MHACGWARAPRCFPLPWGKAPQCHCCPYSVAEQGEPGGGAECSTVKRGCSSCWHLPALTAAGRGKICFSICLCSSQPFPPRSTPPHCPLLPIAPPHPPPPPVSARWLPEHCLPWVMVPDAVCVHRHPHSIHFIPSFLCFSLSSSAGLGSRTQVALCWFLCLSNTTTSRHAHLHTLTPTQLSLLLNCPYLRKCLFSHLLSLTPKLQKYTDFFFPFDQAMAFPHPHLFSMHCMWWHMGAPLWLHIEIENRPPDVASTESQMHLAPLGGASQQHVVPTSWTSPLPSWSQI